MPNRWLNKDRFILLGVSLPFVFMGAGSISFLEPDEGMYGSIAREMVEGGDWITPHYNGVRYLEKPPLYFWLTAFTTALFGPSEWAVRIWSGLPALGAALLTWRMGNLIYGGYAGLLSGLVMISNVGVFRYVRVAATDSLLVFSLTLAMYGFLKATQHQASNAQREWLGPVLFYVGSALGVLSKGLIGAVFPFLIVGLYILFSGERLTPRQMNLRWGLALFFILTLPWHMLAAWKNPGFFEFYIVDNQFLRFLNSRAFIDDDIPLTTFAFLMLSFVWFFPWSFFLGPALCRGFARPRSELPHTERPRLVVGLWALTVIGFFSLSTSKLEHYFLPAIPPSSLMIGGLWKEAMSPGRTNVGLKWCLGAAALGCLLFGVGLLLFSELLTPGTLLAGLAQLNVSYRILQAEGGPFLFPVAPFIQLLKILGAVLVVGVPLSFILFYFRMIKASFATILCVAGVVVMLIFKLLLVIEPYHSVKSLSLIVKAQANQEDAIIHEGSLEYSGGLPFYTGRRIYLLNGRQGDLDFGSRYAESQYLFLDNEEFVRLWQSHRKVFFVTRFGEKESVLHKLPIKGTRFLGRYGSRSLYSNHGP